MGPWDLTPETAKGRVSWEAPGPQVDRGGTGGDRSRCTCFAEQLRAHR